MRFWSTICAGPAQARRKSTVVSAPRTRLKSREVVPAMRQVLVYITLGTVLSAQNPPTPPPQSGQGSSSRETIAKPKTDKQKKKDEAKLRRELETPYKKWLNEEVGYIITDEERRFLRPCRPTTSGRRSSRISGCGAIPLRTPRKTNTARSITAASPTRTTGSRRAFRGGRRIGAGFILSTVRRTKSIRIPQAATYERPYEEGGGSTSTYPFEQWRYRYIEGIGTNIILEFVDTTMSGEYRLTMRSFGKRCAAVRSRRRFDHGRADGALPIRQRGSPAPTVRIWVRAACLCRRA